MTVSHTCKKFGTCFNVTDKTIFNHKHDIVCYTKCLEKSCPHDYVGKSGRRKLERVKDKKNTSHQINASALTNCYMSLIYL